VLEMPPSPTWFAGREEIARFMQTYILREPGQFIMTPTAANGQPALAQYRRDHDGGYHAHGVHVLTLTASGIAQIIAFLDPGLFAAFGLPAALPAGTAPPSRCR
jgi:RNA polymerase sigma-70 factor (ECF subfamily)